MGRIVGPAASASQLYFSLLLSHFPLTCPWTSHEAKTRLWLLTLAITQYFLYWFFFHHYVIKQLLMIQGCLPNQDSFWGWACCLAECLACRRHPGDKVVQWWKACTSPGSAEWWSAEGRIKLLIHPQLRAWGSFLSRPSQNSWVPGCSWWLQLAVSIEFLHAGPSIKALLSP